MDQVLKHSWDVAPQEAIALQRKLAPLVECRDRFDTVSCVAGVDVGFEEEGRVTRAAVAVLSYPDLRPMEQALARRATSFPYIPGLLSFREIPAILAALDQLTRIPDLLLVDGQGYAHPRRLGIASHLGVVSDLPTIGVAKTRLIGNFEAPGPEKGDHSSLADKGEVIGAVLRTRAGVCPIYVSVGHRVSLDTAIRYTLACTSRFRLPETTRAAHRLASG